jgi:hypothetical protein
MMMPAIFLPADGLVLKIFGDFFMAFRKLVAPDIHIGI